MSDHITTRSATGTWSVRAGGAVIGESKNAIELIEGDLPPVIYFPKSDWLRSSSAASDSALL